MFSHLLLFLTYVNLSRLLTTLVSLLMVYGLYDQAWKLWRTKSANDFTKSIVIAIIANELAWLNYGWAIREWPIIGICTLTTIAASWIVIGYVRAIRSDREKKGGGE